MTRFHQITECGSSKPHLMCGVNGATSIIPTSRREWLTFRALVALSQTGSPTGARIGWTWSDRTTGGAVSPASFGWIAPSGDGLDPQPMRLPLDTLGGAAFRWLHTVQYHEVGDARHVDPVNILRWLQTAKLVACSEVDWPVQRLLNAGIVVVQVRHDAEFMRPLSAGDRLNILSRVYELRRVRGTWRQVIYRDGELVGLDYSVGALLNREGRPIPPPRAFPDAFVSRSPAGEPVNE